MDLMFAEDDMQNVRGTLDSSFHKARTSHFQPISSPHSSNSKISYHSGNSDKYDNSRSGSERQRADSDESLNTLIGASGGSPTMNTLADRLKREKIK